MSYGMHNDLIGEFEAYPMAKDTWDKLKNHFGQTSQKVSYFALKVDAIQMGSSRTMVEHLRAMSAMVHDLKAAGKEISKGEQVLNVSQAIPNEPEH